MKVKYTHLGTEFIIDIDGMTVGEFENMVESFFEVENINWEYITNEKDN